MRRSVILVILILCALHGVAAAQPPISEARGGGYFGAPVVKYSVIRDQGALMVGGRGGYNVTPSLLLGAGLYGMINGVDAPEGAVPDAPGRLDVKFESFGFELEYALNPGAPTHPTLGVFFGGGADHYYRHDTNEQHGETDFLLLLEPAVGLEHRLAEWLHLHLAVSYRLVSGVEQPGLDDSDFNGPAVALAFKLGRFNDHLYP
jgi:hypothetical protein